MNQLDTMREMLDEVEIFIGYPKYRIRSRGNNANGIEVFAIDVYNARGDIINHAERMGSLNEMYLYISGMYQIVNLVRAREGI